MLRRCILVTVLLCLVCLPGWAADVDLLMGNPSQAQPDPTQKNNFLMNKTFYALSYNDSTGTPNWVSWHLTQQHFGDAPRKRKFDADTTPVSYTHLTLPTIYSV